MFFPYFADIPTTSYSGNADSTLFMSAFFMSILFATTRTGIFLATRFPIIVILTCEYGFCVESKNGHPFARCDVQTDRVQCGALLVGIGEAHRVQANRPRQTGTRQELTACGMFAGGLHQGVQTAIR